MNHWQPELGSGPRGSFDFGNAITSLNTAAIAAAGGFQGGTPSFENGWNGMAGFLLGMPTGSGKSSQFIKMDSLENVFGLYIRDRWRVTPKLTLNLGLRWELYPNRTTRSAGLGIESYDPNTNEVLVGGRGGIPQDNGVGYSKKLFAPRVGFAYQLDNSTVIRSGYGLTFHSHPWGAQALRGWYPLTIVAVFSDVYAYQPVTTDPNYVAAGVPNQPLGPTVGIPQSAADINKGRIPLPSSTGPGYPVANRELHRGYIQSWNFIIERKLPAEVVASVGYVGTASVNGFAFLDVNASQIAGSGNAGRPLFAKFGRTATTREWDGRTHSNYHSLQATVNRRLPTGCSSRVPTPTPMPSIWLAIATGRHSAGMRRRVRSNRASAANNIPHVPAWVCV
jgi:hypothetical protein